MQTLHLIAGTPEWHAHRSQHRNASDAPAMLGCSPYTTRPELLRRTHTGIAAEVDAGTQRIFDNGHRFEALARPLAEEIIGDDLAPVVGVLEGTKFSASFDGLTLMGDTAFEHKTLNDSLRYDWDQGNGYHLPKHYRVQMEQQLLVSGAERVLFMASKWDGDTLVEERHCWYASDPQLRAELVAGWTQFEADLAAYKPAEAVAEVVGRTPESLPAIRIELTGAVTASNLGAFKTHALEVIEAINTDLQTDQDFADAEKAVKWCGDVEDRIAAAKQHALSQTDSIDAVFRMMDEIAAEVRAKRLNLTNKVKAEKENRRGEIVAGGISGLRDHVTNLNARLGKPYMPAIPADFAGAIKGKKSLDSMKDAVSTVLANAKIEANRIADLIDANLKTLAAAEPATLFPDTAQLVLKAADDLAAVIASRIAAHKAAEEAKAKVVEAPAVTPAPAPAPAVISMPARAAAAPADDGSAPTLRLGAIAERLGWSMTAEQLRALGIEPAGRDRAATLYHERQFADICEAIVKRALLVHQDFLNVARAA